MRSGASASALSVGPGPWTHRVAEQRGELQRDARARDMQDQALALAAAPAGAVGRIARCGRGRRARRIVRSSVSPTGSRSCRPAAVFWHLHDHDSISRVVKKAMGGVKINDNLCAEQKYGQSAQRSACQEVMELCLAMPRQRGALQRLAHITEACAARAW